jgi:predicted membrane-bound spermidine synthase
MSADSFPSPEDSSHSPESTDPEHTYRLSSPNPMMDDAVPPPVFSPTKTFVKKLPTKSKRADYWALWGYNVLVFVTSVCVMTLELTASRLISKTVGSSLYTWTSVIGVVLAGITLGNWLGGWLADRYDRGRALAWMYLLGSVSCASVLWLDQIIAPLDRPSMFSWPAWILTVVGSIFLLPSLALGTISPLVASMALARSTKTGSTVGNVYAWGAFGSIVGTFLTGFYLIDMWGTRTIVGLTATTLGLLAVIVGGSGKVFRASVVCGWMQLLGWTVLAATCTQPMLAAVGQTVGSTLSVTQPKSKAMTTRERWSHYGGTVGLKLHELGLLLKLRDDRVGTYYDESNYSTIIVGQDEAEDGTPIKYLRLDKLIHSYYDPLDPTALHYEYEQVYAAVTKATAKSLVQPVTLSITSLPKDAFDATKLPVGVTFDEKTSLFRIDQPSQAVFDALLELSSDAPFWKAITELHRDTNAPLWGGFSSVALEQMPEGITIPESLGPTLRHDPTLGIVTAYQALTNETRDQLIHNTPSGAWHREIETARGMSRRATALFVGGGGYIFPRWFLKEFPGSPNIEVAELDPAVYRAVVKELGLTEVEQKRIVTTLGDARNFVDDRLRENQMLVAAGQPAVRYDFIYGDAFNDFSIPFHLTTREFLQDTHDLLTDEGVYQANIIDIYPRTEYPGEAVGEGEVGFNGVLPKGLAGTTWTYGRFESAGRGFAPLEVKWLKNDDYRIRCTRAITPTEQTRLKNVRFADPPVAKKPGDPELPFGVVTTADRSSEAWSSAITELARQSNRRKHLEGALPSKLNATGSVLEAWIPADAPFECVEVLRLDGDRNVLGFRGIVSENLKQKLIDLEPQNVAWTQAVAAAAKKSRAPGAGRFLGRYVATAATVFPNIYVFSTSSAQPDSERDTFVMVCSRKPLDLTHLADTGDWMGGPFAAIETRPGQAEPTLSGQMSAVLALSEGHLLTDDFAPVDNLLRPVFADQE